MTRRAFESELLDGHKGPAVLVPFDPEKEWGVSPCMVTSDAYGRRPGHLVTGRLNGKPFDGWIGHRWGRFFILVDEKLRREAGVRVGDTVEVVVQPRKSEAVRASASERPRAKRSGGGRATKAAGSSSSRPRA